MYQCGRWIFDARLVSRTTGDEEINLQRCLNFYGGAIPLGQKKAVTTAIRVDSFFKGIKFFTEKLWPASFYGLLAHDLISYAVYSNDRYGTKLWQIFVGMPTNEQTLTTYLNESVWWFAILMGTPMVIGLLRQLQSCCDRKNIQNLIEFFREYRPSVFKDVLMCLNPFYSLNRCLNQIEELLLWDRKKAEEIFANTEADVLPINASKKLTRLQVLKIFAEQINALDARDLHRFSALGIDIDLMRERKQKALETLREYSHYRLENNETSVIRYIYANYLLWSIGRLEKHFLEPFFWFYEIGVIYAKLRLYESIAQFLYQELNYFQQWYECQREQKVYTYIQQSGKRECTICGDWSHMYYHDVFDGQSCVDGALNREHSPQEILTILERVNPFGISSIDLSKQLWTSWDRATLQDVLQAVNKTSRGCLTNLDMSCVTTDSEPLNVTSAQVLAAFISSTRIKSVSFSNQNFPPEIVQILADGMADNALVAINFAGNNLGNEGSKALGKALTTLSTLKEVDLSRANATDEGIQNLAIGFRELSLRRLFLQRNCFGAAGVQVLAENLHIVNVLDISENNFQNVSLSTLIQCNITKLICAGINLADKEFVGIAKTLKESTITSLDLSNNRLTAISGRILGEILPNAFLHEVSLSGNAIGDEGLEGLSLGLTNSSLTTLQLSQTGISNTGITIFSEYLPQTKIVHLGLAFNRFSVSGMKKLSVALSSSCVEILDISANDLTDDGIKSLTSVLEQENCLLAEINLGSSLMTPIGAEALANALRNNTSVKTLIISGNTVQDGGFKAITSILPNSQINHFECSTCEITEEGAEALASNLNTSKTMVVVLNNNQLGYKSGWQIAKALIQPIPNNQNLGNPYVSRDFARAVHNARASTNVTAISLMGNQLQNFDARSFCRVLPSTPMRPEDLALSGNPIDPNQVDMQSCWISPGSRTEPPFFAYVQTATNCAAMISSETDSFLKTVFEIISAVGIKQQLIPCLAAFALAFRQEALDKFIQQLDVDSQKMMKIYVAGVDGLVLANFTEMALRIKYHGAPSMVHDITLVCKTTYQNSAKEKSKENLTVLPKIIVSVGMVAGIYGISWAVSSIAGSPIVASLALPVIFNGKKILAAAQTGYQRYGLFGGVCGALEAIAYSVPGGHILEKTQQENGAIRRVSNINQSK